MTKSSRPTFGRLLRRLLATSALVVAAQTASVHAASAAQTQAEARPATISVAQGPLYV